MIRILGWREAGREGEEGRERKREAGRGRWDCYLFLDLENRPFAKKVPYISTIQ